jgi:hypothetical protein
MSQANPRMREYARCLTTHETRRNALSRRKAPPAFQVCEKLRAYLATFMGTAGFREVLLCALPRATSEIPWLRAVHVNADGSLEGLEKLQARLDPDKLVEGEVVLVAQFLALLEAFIGEGLTLRLVREIWPTIPLNDLDSSKGDKNEKAK